MTATDDAMIQAMTWQANHMLAGMAAQLVDMFPQEEDPALVVTGFVFRPAEDEDLDPDEDPDPDENLYVFEAHFNATNHPMVGNLTTSLLVNLEDCDTYVKARDRFVSLVKESQAKEAKLSLHKMV